MSEDRVEECRHFYVRAKFIPVPWESLENGQVFWYFVTKHKRNDQEAHGPFVMVDKDAMKIKNPQDVELSFEKLKAIVQPMTLVGVE